MKTGYDQHFKKIKQTGVSSGKKNTFDFNLNQKSMPSKKQSGNKSQFPVMPLFSFVLIAALGLLFLENFDSVDAYLKKIEVGVGTAIAADAAPQVKEVKEAPAAVANVDTQAIAIEAKPMDDTDYLFKLADRKKQLDAREIELNELAARLKTQEEELSVKLAALEETRKKISTALEEKIKVDDGKVETLVQMYSNMKPNQAAKVFETLDEELVIEILGRMKKKEAANILNLIKPEKAQVFAERFAGYRAPASN